MKKTALFLSILLCAGVVSCDAKPIKSEENSGNTAVTDGQTDANEKVTLKLAVAHSYNEWIGWQSLYGKIDQFNDTSENCTIEVVTYECDENDYSGNSAVQRLSMDILAGNAPDIISTSPFHINKFRRNGYLADISPLMENSDGLKREDFLDSVINGIDNDGEIYAVYPAFAAYTAIAKTEFVGENAQNWTIQNAIDNYNSFEGDFLSNMATKYDIRNYFFKGIMVNCIDFENYTCDFQRGLSPALSFLADIPPMEKRHGEDVGQIRNNTALVHELWINGISNYYSQQILSNFGNEPFTFVGYPTNNGNGTFIDTGSVFGVTATGKNKELAWKTLSEILFSTSFQTEISDKGYGVPVTKKAVNKLVDLAEYNVKSINAPVTLPDGTSAKLSDIQKQQFVDYLNNMEINPFTESSMEQTIKAECDYVFEGNRSVEECVNTLQNTVELYLSETK